MARNEDDFGGVVGLYIHDMIVCARIARTSICMNILSQHHQPQDYVEVL
jgi:hypothetical protein